MPDAEPCPIRVRNLRNKNRIMQINIKKFTYTTGLTGICFITAGSLITAIFYRGKNDELYSPLNHFISELGQVGVSQLAPVFNSGLIVGGLFFALFMFGLGLYFRNWLAYIGGLVGIFSGISCSLVGIFPMNNLTTHIAVALSFFRSGLIAILLFSVVIILDKKQKMSKKLIIPGIITVLAFASFLFIPKMVEPGAAANLLKPKAVRPEFFVNSILEWLVFATVLIWVVCLAIYLIKKGKETTGSLFLTDYGCK